MQCNHEQASNQASEQASNHTAAMPCCNAMLHGNVTMQCCIAGGSPVTHLRTLVCNAMQRNAKQVSKHAGMQAGKQASTSRWVTGDPPAKQAVWLLTFGSTQASTSPYFDLQCNAMQCNASNAMQCNAMQCCDAMLRCNAGIYCCKALLAMLRVPSKSLISSLIGLSRWGHILHMIYFPNRGFL